MFGAGTPSRIWKQFLDAATKAMDWKQQDFPQRQNTGDKEKFGNGIKLPDQPQNDCALALIGIACNGPGNNNGPGGNGGPGNGNGNGNGNGGGGGDNGGATAFPLATATAGTG